jgi:DNA invertase Pin-like site-specific DNA recombinase
MKGNLMNNQKNTEIETKMPICEAKLRVTFYLYLPVTAESNTAQADQVEFFENYISRNPGWTLIPGYVDAAQPGHTRAGRKQFKRMLADAEANQFDLLLTAGFSQFSRHLLCTLRYVHQLCEQCVDVHFLENQFYSRGAEGRLYLTTLLKALEEEAKKLKQQSKSTQEIEYSADLSANNPVKKE